MKVGIPFRNEACVLQTMGVVCRCGGGVMCGVRAVCGLLGAGFVHNGHRIIIQGDLHPNGFSVCQ